MSEKLIPEQTFPRQEVAMLDDFNQTLRQLGQYMNDDPDGGNNYLNNTLGAAFGDVMTPGRVADGTKRVVLAEIAGAASNQYDSQSAFEALITDPSFDDSDKSIISSMFTNNLYMRHSGMDIEQQAGVVVQEVSSIMYGLQTQEAAGQDKSAMKSTVLAFGAGATIRTPQLQLAEQLMQDVYSQVSA